MEAFVMPNAPIANDTPLTNFQVNCNSLHTINSLHIF